MRSMTATEAARNFSAVLDAVEAGETIVVTRDGLPVARFEPTRAGVAERIADVMARFPADPEWADDLEQTVRDLRSEMPNQEREWPDS
jgi:antitoxin (DNA-binding transcriptional repressor) of toxin-antitoxin stability system